MIALVACNTQIDAMRAVPREEQELRMYGRDIAIFNNSEYELTVIVNNERHKPTEIRIPSQATMSIPVAEHKNVNITADVDGKLMKGNFKRDKNTENYWEVTITKTFAGGIKVATRQSKVRTGSM